MRTPIRTLVVVVAGATAALGAQLGLATTSHAATTPSITVTGPDPGVLTVGKATTISTHLTGNGTAHSGTMTFDINGLSVLEAKDFTLTTAAGTKIPLTNDGGVDVTGSITLLDYLPATGVKSSGFILTAKPDAVTPVRGQLYVFAEFVPADNSFDVDNQGLPLQVPKATPYKVGQNVGVVRRDANGLPDIYYANGNTSGSSYTEVIPGTSPTSSGKPSLASVLRSTSTVVAGDLFGSGDDYPVYYTSGTHSTFYIVDGFTTVDSDGSGVVEASDYQAVVFGLAGDIPLVGAFPIPSTSSVYPYGSVDTIAVWRPSNQHFYVDGGSSAGLKFGIAGDKPVVGNWTGTRDSAADQGGDGVGVFRPSNHTWYLLEQSGSYVKVGFGITSDTPVVGDWAGNGVSTIGVQRGNTFYLAKSNTSSAVASTFHFGIAGDGSLAAFKYTSADVAAVGAANAPDSVVAHAVAGRSTHADALRTARAGTRAIG